MTACAYTATELDAKIAKVKVTIEAYEDAILALSSGAQMYSLDTGQTKQTVSRAQLSQLKNTLASLDNRLAVLTARRGGGGVYARPGF